MRSLQRADVEHVFDADTGATIHRLGAVESVEACDFCGAPIVKRTATQRTCGEERCRTQLRFQRPASVAANRARNRAWAVEHRAVSRANPWLAGEPPHESYLPGGFLDIASSAPPKWPVEHRNLRGVHGMLSHVVARPHDPRLPDWALVPRPTSFGWGAYFRCREDVERLRAQSFDVRFFAQPMSVKFSGAHWMKAPHGLARGHRRVRVTAITPIVVDVRLAVARRFTTEAVEKLLVAHDAHLATRLGLDGFDAALVRAEIVEHDMHTETVNIGARFGVLRGFVGSFVVEGNAVARWLLHAAGRGPGLGWQTSVGFGHVRVEDI